MRGCTLQACCSCKALGSRFPGLTSRPAAAAPHRPPPPLHREAPSPRPPPCTPAAARRRPSREGQRVVAGSGGGRLTSCAPLPAIQPSACSSSHSPALACSTTLSRRRTKSKGSSSSSEKRAASSRRPSSWPAGQGSSGSRGAQSAGGGSRRSSRPGLPWPEHRTGLQDRIIKQVAQPGLEVRVQEGPAPRRPALPPPPVQPAGEHRFVAGERAGLVCAGGAGGGGTHQRWAASWGRDAPQGCSSS